MAGAESVGAVPRRAPGEHARVGRASARSRGRGRCSWRCRRSSARARLATRGEWPTASIRRGWRCCWRCSRSARACNLIGEDVFVNVAGGMTARRAGRRPRASRRPSRRACATGPLPRRRRSSARSDWPARSAASRRPRCACARRASSASRRCVRARRPNLDPDDPVRWPTASANWSRSRSVARRWMCSSYEFRRWFISRAFHTGRRAMAWFILARVLFVGTVAYSAALLRPVHAAWLPNVAVRAGDRRAVRRLRDPAPSHARHAHAGRDDRRRASASPWRKTIGAALFWANTDDRARRLPALVRAAGAAVSRARASAAARASGWSRRGIVGLFRGTGCRGAIGSSTPA